jgi:hypothetical protein
MWGYAVHPILSGSVWMSKLRHGIWNSEFVRFNSSVWMATEFTSRNQPKFQTEFDTPVRLLPTFRAQDQGIARKSPSQRPSTVPHAKERERALLDGRKGGRRGRNSTTETHVSTLPILLHAPSISDHPPPAPFSLSLVAPPEMRMAADYGGRQAWWPTWIGGVQDD